MGGERRSCREGGLAGNTQILSDRRSDLTQKWEREPGTRTPRKVPNVAVEGAKKQSFPFWAELHFKDVFDCPQRALGWTESNIPTWTSKVQNLLWKKQ